MRSKLKNLFVVIVTLFFSFQLMAQKITGTVTDMDNLPLSGVNIAIKGMKKVTTTDAKGYFMVKVNSLPQTLIASTIGMETKTIEVTSKKHLNIQLSPSTLIIEDIAIEEAEYDINETVIMGYASPKMAKSYIQEPNYSTESYAPITENGFRDVLKNPLSTFSVDVDAASYANMRRFINNGSLPPSGAVRVEEMINYFNYDYPQPKENTPFSINSELSYCPWKTDNLLLHIGLQGKSIEMENLPASNIVFLLDVSGSMDSPNKLPLLKSSFKMLLDQLSKKDRVAIVVYAGSSGLVLPSTSCNNRDVILKAIEKLDAGGSTAGGEGLKLAYKVAKENFIKDGNNRIVLATDGDFNVGRSSNGDIEDMIEKERESGVAISVLGFGMGNYKDDKMEIIADKGNGNYAYIDNLLEAKKVLVNEFGGTFFTIAKDVKFQLEFNPAIVSEYRLIGYENRLLNEEDFDDDTKDAGEIGAGHSVTALYEIVLNKETTKTSGLKYQTSQLTNEAINSNDLITLALRYKKPDGNKSILISKVVKNKPIALTKTSNNYRYSAAISEFGMLLNDSKYKGTSTWLSAKKLATEAKGKDTEGYRGEMIRLIDHAALLSEK